MILNIKETSPIKKILNLKYMILNTLGMVLLDNDQS